MNHSIQVLSILHGVSVGDKIVEYKTIVDVVNST
jgi:hypothetical protein